MKRELLGKWISKSEENIDGESAIKIIDVIDYDKKSGLYVVANTSNQISEHALISGYKRPTDLVADPYSTLDVGGGDFNRVQKPKVIEHVETVKNDVENVAIYDPNKNWSNHTNEKSIKKPKVITENEQLILSMVQKMTDKKVSDPTTISVDVKLEFSIDKLLNSTDLLGVSKVETLTSIFENISDLIELETIKKSIIDGLKNRYEYIDKNCEPEQPKEDEQTTTNYDIVDNNIDEMLSIGQAFQNFETEIYAELENKQPDILREQKTNFGTGVVEPYVRDFDNDNMESDGIN